MRQYNVPQKINNSFLGFLLRINIIVFWVNPKALSLAKEIVERERERERRSSLPYRSHHHPLPKKYDLGANCPSNKHVEFAPSPHTYPHAGTTLTFKSKFNYPYMWFHMWLYRQPTYLYSYSSRCFLCPLPIFQLITLQTLITQCFTLLYDPDIIS